MALFGKPLSEYVRFSRTLLGVIVLVGVARLTLSLAGVPDSIVRWISMSAVMWVGVVYYAILAARRAFGGYRHLLGVVAIPNLAAQVIAIIGIAIAIFTGAGNIFTSPEHAFGGDGRTWLHLGSHAAGGTTVGTLIYWLVGCLFMFAAGKVSPGPRDTEEPARAWPGR